MFFLYLWNLLLISSPQIKKKTSLKSSSFLNLKIFLHAEPRTATFELSWVAGSNFLLLRNWCCGMTLTTPNCIRSHICSIPGAEHSLILASLGLIFGQCVRKGNSLMLSVQFWLCNYYALRMEKDH